MLLEISIITVTLIALLIASYTDLKTREVPDWLNYGFIFLILGVRGIFSITGGWEIIVSGLIGLVVCIIVAYIFYYAGLWGGGDSKLLMGMGAAIGITFPFESSSWYLLLFFFSLMFLGAFYGLLWMFMIAIVKRKKFVKWFKESLKVSRKLHVSVWIMTLMLAVLTYFFVLLWPLIFFPIGVYYIFLFVNTVENSCFTKRISIKKLTIGDWLAKDVKVENKILMSEKTLEERDLNKLKKLSQKYSIRSVIIKEGIPFVPSFLLSYILLTFGKELFNVIMNLI